MRALPRRTTSRSSHARSTAPHHTRPTLHRSRGHHHHTRSSLVAGCGDLDSARWVVWSCLAAVTPDQPHCTTPAQRSIDTHHTTLSLGRSQYVCKGSRLTVEGERCVVSSRSLLKRLGVNAEEEVTQRALCSGSSAPAVE